MLSKQSWNNLIKKLKKLELHDLKYTECNCNVFFKSNIWVQLTRAGVFTSTSNRSGQLTTARNFYIMVTDLLDLEQCADLF